MKILFNWVIKNLWNLFGVLGVIGTFYFSLLHVPDYVKEITTGKVSVIHESLINNVQELLFYEKELTIDDIDTFIRGKELKEGVAYPYNTDELLIQVQERFLENTFIPLEKRELLIKNINVIRINYKPPEESSTSPFGWVLLLSWLASGLGVLIASLGMASIVKKHKSDKETVADFVSGDVVINNVNSSRTAAYEYEKMVGETLEELGVLNEPLDNRQLDKGYDFLATKDNSQYLVEVKRFSRLLGLSTAREFMYAVISADKGGILISYSGVTERTKQLVNEHNEISGKKVYLVTGTSKEAIKKQLTSIFNA